MRESTRILVQVDKTVIKITGLSVRGLKINELEQLLQERLQSMVRIIGVSGSQIEMDGRIGYFAGQRRHYKNNRAGPGHPSQRYCGYGTGAENSSSPL